MPRNRSKDLTNKQKEKLAQRRAYANAKKKRQLERLAKRNKKNIERFFTMEESTASAASTASAESAASAASAESTSSVASSKDTSAEHKSSNTTTNEQFLHPRIKILRNSERRRRMPNLKVNTTYKV